MQKTSKKSKNKTIQKQNSIGTSKLLLIFVGTILMLFGILIGDFTYNNTTISYYYIIILGILLQAFSILLFMKENTIKTD